MKVLLIGFTKLAYMPYMNFYIDQLVNNDHQIHLLYWNRDEEEDIKINEEIKLHEFKSYQEDEVAKIKKLKNFIKFRKKAIKILAEIEFDLIVVMHTVPAIIIFDILNGAFKKKYILDYRDITYEGNIFYKRLINRITKNSIATFVSSDAFREVLPKDSNIYTSHNLLLDSLDFRDVRRKSLRERQPIRIRFWGFIRHENINIKLIEKLGNDFRFELHYHGREQETANSLKNHCKSEDIKNVFFHGEYKPIDRYDFASRTDMIHNFYENDKKTDKAMGNKYYDGVIFYIPQICIVNSVMGKMVEVNKIGLECDVEDVDFANKIFNYYNLVNWHEFERNCNIELNRILNEYNLGRNIFSEVLENHNSKNINVDGSRE